jgi:inhibitor of cysteine peptidase
MRNLSIVFAFFIFIFCFGCAQEIKSDSSNATVSGPSNSIIYSDTGVVTYVNLEGGFYGIIGSTGIKYDPTNLSASYKMSGLKVSFTYTIPIGVSGTHMWGKVIKISSIKKI